MTISERNERALAYIEKCERRRQRKARRRQRKIDRFALYIEPIAGIAYILLIILALA